MKRAPYIAVLSKSGKGRHVDMRVIMPTHVARGRKTLQTYGFPIQTYGKLQSATTLIQRRESTIPAIKFLVFIHSACPFKIMPQVLPVPP